MHAFASLDRRSLLLRAFVLAGATMVPPAAWASAAKNTPRTLARAQFALLSAIADTMIPRTDTPGARAVGVPALFDALLGKWASTEHRTQIVASMSAIDRAAGGFVKMPAAKRHDMLAAYDRSAVPADSGYAKLKELIVVLYYFSEPGATVELRYEHAPGVWQASIPITPQTRRWAGAASM
jgi:Gluconate 2-dehydrogenase subunit 3